MGDFSVAAIEVNGVSHEPGAGKLPSTDAPTLRLRRNPKLLDTLRGRSRNPHVDVVAFKLTRGAGEKEARAAVNALFATGAADVVVHNDLDARGVGAGEFPADIWGAGDELVARCPDRAALAFRLEALLRERASSRNRTPPVPG